MLDARRYRAAAAHLRRAARRRAGVRFREAPLPPSLRRAIAAGRRAAPTTPELLGAALGRLLLMPPADRPAPHRRRRGSPSPSASPTCASCCAAARFSFEEAVARRRPHDGRGDAVRAARAVQARRGRAGSSTRPSARSPSRATHARAGACAARRRRRAARPGERRRAGRRCRSGVEGDRRAGAHRRGAAVPLRRPAQRRPSWPRRPGGEGASAAPRSALLARAVRARAARASCCASSAAAGRSPATRSPRTPRGGCSAGRGWRRSRPAQAETLAIVAYLQPVSRPEIARIRGVSADSADGDAARARPDRGGRPLAVRRRALPHDDAVPEAVRPARAAGAARRSRSGTRRPEEQASCASGCCAPARPRRRGPPRLPGGSPGRSRAGVRPAARSAASMSRPRVRRTVRGTPRAWSARGSARSPRGRSPRSGEPVGL